MKKKIITIFFAIIIIVCIVTKNKNKYLAKIKNITLENIEALAVNEDDRPDFGCFGKGAVDCYGAKVEYMGKYDETYRFFDFN